MATNPNQVDGGNQDGEAKATNPNQVDAGNQDGEAMADVPIAIAMSSQVNEEKVGEVHDRAVEIVAGLADGTTDEDEDEELPIAFKPISGPRIKLTAAAGGGQPRAVRSGEARQVLTSEQVDEAIQRYKGMLTKAAKEGQWSLCVEYETMVKKYETMQVEIAKKKKMREKTPKELKEELKKMTDKHEDLMDEMSSLKAKDELLHFQDYLITQLYKHYPVRNDFHDTKVVSKRDYNKLSESDKRSNNFVVDSRPMLLILNEYKTWRRGSCRRSTACRPGCRGACTTRP
eukprot:SAG22_NODE_683_length_7924_cov_13.017508_3_plen_287_part_00